MPLFDPNAPASAEAGALWHLAELISQCEAAQRLAEETAGTDEENEDATRLKVIIGPHEGSWDGDQFTKDELAVRFIEFHLWAPEEGGRTVVASDSSFDRADEGGEFILQIRRHAREAESASDLYLWFLDNVSALEAEMMVKAESRECPRLQAVTRQQIGFAPKSQIPEQGDYVHATHTITWGDPIGDQ